MGCCCGGCTADRAKSGGPQTSGERWLARLDAVQSYLERWPCLVVSAFALLASLLLGGGACHAHAASRPTAWFDPAWIALVLCGLPLLKFALVSLLRDRRIKSPLLISSAMIACVAIGQLFAAGEVAFIMMLGEKLEDWTARRARQGLSKLVSLVPLKARRVVTCPKCLARGERFKEVPTGDIAVGDGVRVLPGETIPVDGVITEGATTIDQSIMTGESLPVEKAVGDEVHSGTINRFGAITLRATKAGEDSSLQKLIRLVQDAEKRKAPMQRIADKWASILVPCSLSIALLTFLGVWLALGDAHVALLRGVTILVVFCPCALALATPTAIMAAIGQATKHGVIIKSGDALERMGAVTVACLDKTGTLTKGELSLACVKSFGAHTPDEVLALAAAVERSSTHPLAQAIVAAAPRERAGEEVEDFQMTPGQGVKAHLAGRLVLCGNPAWLEAHALHLTREQADIAQALRQEGKAVVLVATDHVEGLVALSDAIRDDARAMLDALAAIGLKSVLLTGDHASTARFVAERLGIDDVQADLLPTGKADVIDHLQSGGARVAMIGDGVNDALALKTASVGIAMGRVGCDIAVEAADIALVGESLAKIPYLKRLSNACVKLIKFNITLSMCINAVAIGCSIGGVLTPVTGALVHNLGSILVVLNAALLYDRKNL